MLKYFEKLKRPLNTDTRATGGSSNNPNVGVDENIGSGNDEDIVGNDELPIKRIRVEGEIELNDEDIVGDPALRKPLEKYDPRIREEVRRRLILNGACQPLLDNYPLTRFGDRNRQFQKHWFVTYPWLEYSESSDAVFCFYCYLFKGEMALTKCGDEAFTKKGFRDWKKGTLGLNKHVGVTNSVHSYCQTKYFGFKDQKKSIIHNMASGKTKVDEVYRTRLTASVDVSRLLLRNGLPFRGHDESKNSSYKGNFLETLEWYGERCSEVGKVVLENAPGNNQLTSPRIQKDIISACAAMTTSFIINDIGERVFSILLDGARDTSVKEQMAFVLRYVNDVGEVLERFVGITHVSDTSSQSLKDAVDNFLTNHGLSISKVRGQGYDGASNMRGELNGLKALILNENNCAWYVHCFAHQLQLVVVSVAEEIQAVRQFFDYVSMIVTAVGGSCKRKDALRQKHHDQLVQSVERGEISSGKGLNQETSLARHGETRWGSHYKTITRLLSMWSAVLQVLHNIYLDGVYKSQRAQVLGLGDKMESYEFVFIAYLMKEILGLTAELSFFLQQKDQNIVAAVNLIDSTKTRFQQLRNDGWDNLIEQVNSFCTSNGISIINMEDKVSGRFRSHNAPTYYHYYHVEIFCQVTDRIMGEMNSRFTEANSELLMCTSCLDPRNSFEKFSHSKLLRLASLYPNDFSSQDILELEIQLQNYIINMRQNGFFANLAGIGALSKKMVEYGFHTGFHLVYRLIELALVLPVATATVERAFSAMKIIKTDLRNKMGDEFLKDCMICYVEKDTFLKIENEAILTHFQNMKTRRNLLSLPDKN